MSEKKHKAVQFRKNKWRYRGWYITKLNYTVCYQYLIFETEEDYLNNHNISSYDDLKTAKSSIDNLIEMKQILNNWDELESNTQG